MCQFKWRSQRTCIVYFHVITNPYCLTVKPCGDVIHFFFFKWQGYIWPSRYILKCMFLERHYAYVLIIDVAMAVPRHVCGHIWFTFLWWRTYIDPRAKLHHRQRSFSVHVSLLRENRWLCNHIQSPPLTKKKNNLYHSQILEFP